MAKQAKLRSGAHASVTKARLSFGCLSQLAACRLAQVAQMSRLLTFLERPTVYSGKFLKLELPKIRR